GQFLLGDSLVLDDVVQQCRHERLGIELPAGTDFRDGNGVRNIGFAASTELAKVSLVGESVGVFDAFDFLGLEVMFNDFRKGSKRGNRAAGSRGFGQRGGWRATP